jgi:CBS-domain-containing membrane protein
MARDYVKSHGHKAADVMTRDVITVGEEMPLGEVAEILEKRHIKRVPVMRDGALVGIVSRANLLQGLAARRGDVSRPPAADDYTLRLATLGEVERCSVISLRQV